MSKIIWHTEKRKLSELKNWEKNPRTISKEEKEKLKKSLEELGNFEPLVINIDGTVIAGNQRLDIEKEGGNTEIEVNVPSRELSEKEVKKIGVISNRHSGVWDMDILANEFEDVLGELGFDELLSRTDIGNEEEIDYEQKFQIVIECTNELEQQEIFNKLQAEGYKCKPLIF